MYIYHAVLNFKGLENAAEDLLLYCKFRKRKSKHNIEDIFDSTLYNKHFDCGGYFL